MILDKWTVIQAKKEVIILGPCVVCWISQKYFDRLFGGVESGAGRIYIFIFVY